LHTGDTEEYGFLFTARKAPCDSAPIFEKPLVNFTFNQSKPQNHREWLLKLQNEKIQILLEDVSTRNEWVTAIRMSIKISNESYQPAKIQHYPPPVLSNSNQDFPTFAVLDEPSYEEHTGSLDRNFRSGKFSQARISNPICSGSICPIQLDDQRYTVKKPTRSKSLKTTRPSESHPVISGPMSETDPELMNHQFDSPHRHGQRNTIHYPQSSGAGNIRLLNASARNSSGSIDNFQHLMKRSQSEEKMGEPKSSGFARGINRISARFKMPARFLGSKSTPRDKKSVSQTP
jgi:hypothetical protein